ncbi:UDP-N-acetylmuramate dehydrogenase [Endothiovibrio diazotrophicus]
MMAARAHPGLRGELRFDEPLARYTTWRVGGPAERLYRPADLEDLVAFLQGLPADEPLFWLGLGSNLLVRSGGIRGTVVALSGTLNGLRRVGETKIRAEAGVACAQLARFAGRAGLSGAEFLAGIPGTVGGALAMNAGAFGGEIWRRVAGVETVDRRGVLRARGAENFTVGYRSVAGPVGEWFVAATLELEPGAEDGRVRELLERRNRTQPIGEPSCGSVFRNPEGDHAARLIEAAGLKGSRIGGACVSQKHANFIVNDGGATPEEIETLIERVRAEVERVHGVCLQHEVRIVGERSDG